MLLSDYVMCLIKVVSVKNSVLTLCSFKLIQKNFQTNFNINYQSKIEGRRNEILSEGTDSILATFIYLYSFK